MDDSPQWSAGGDFLVFFRLCRQRSAPASTVPADAEQAELWTVSPEGSETQLLTSDVQRLGNYYGLFDWQRLTAWERLPVASAR